MSLLIYRFDAKQLFGSDRLLRLREQSHTNNKFRFLSFFSSTIVIETKEKLVSTNAFRKNDLPVIFSRVSHGFDVRYLSVDKAIEEEEENKKKKFCFFFSSELLKAS